MTTRCKAGDMAIIVHDDKDRDVGMIVDVVQRWLDTRRGPNWIITRRDGGLLWCYAHFMGLAIPWKERLVVCPDAWLKPIRGLPTADTVERQQEVTA